MTLPVPRKLPARVVEARDAAPGVRILHIELEGRQPPDFRAGQYARLEIPGHPARPYSIACAPGAGLLEFHIKDAGETGGALAHGLRPGDGLNVDFPHGAHIWRGHEKSTLMVAGGVGIAPMKALVEEALGQGFAHPIHLYWGVRDRTGLYLSDHLRKLAARHAQFHFIPVLWEEKNPDFRTGSPARAACGDFDTLQEFCAYVAGPGPMVEETVRLLAEKGLEKDSLFCDSFT